MSDFRPVFYLIGLILIALGLFMALPAVIDLSTGQANWNVFVASSLFTLFFGGILVLTTRMPVFTLTLRQAFLFTVLSWIVVSAFGGLPLLFSSLNLSFTDAFFETISGLTTTGSTILAGLDSMSHDILLWRGLIQLFGGVGIIGMAVAVMPMLQVGGAQLFRMESSDRSEKIMPRQHHIVGLICLVYLLLVALCAFFYKIFGMTGFEAAVHAMTTLSTGGYSTSDSSMGHFPPGAIRWTGTVFMLLGSFPLVLFIPLLQGRPRPLLRDGQVRFYISFLAVVIFILSWWLVKTNGKGWGEAVELVAFNVVSVVTTTGYATTDYTLWGPFAIAVIFCLTFVGGCSGSTAGGIKMYRFQVMYETMRMQMHRLLYPRGTYIPRYNKRPLPDDVSASVMAFIFILIVFYVFLVLGLLAAGLDFTASVSGAATAMANVGPGLGQIIGPAGNFSSVSDSAKWLLSLGMLMGRLEFFTVLVLFSPRFWKA